MVVAVIKRIFLLSCWALSSAQPGTYHQFIFYFNNSNSSILLFFLRAVTVVPCNFLLKEHFFFFNFLQHKHSWYCKKNIIILIYRWLALFACYSTVYTIALSSSRCSMYVKFVVFVAFNSFNIFSPTIKSVNAASERII